MEKRKLKLLYGEEVIRSRIRSLGKEILDSYKDDEPILCVGVLRGAVLFFSDLVKSMPSHRIMFDFISLSSYGDGMQSSGNVRLKGNGIEDLSGKHLLLIEDIVDSGQTIRFLREYFGAKHPIDIKVACLLDKPMTRVVEENADFTAFTLTRPAFIVGYGLDYAQIYRNLDGIYEIVDE